VGTPKYPTHTDTIKPWREYYEPDADVWLIGAICSEIIAERYFMGICINQCAN
jgi:hypothetical protein